MNLYRVYSDPAGKDQHVVIAPNQQEAIDVLSGKLTDPANAKAFFRGSATTKQLVKAYPSNILIAPKN